MDPKQYHLGISEIDKSHKRLLVILEKLNQCIPKTGYYSKEELSILLADAKEFATVHFQQEEDLMAIFAYPLLEEHCAEHEVFFKKLEAIKKSAQGTLDTQKTNEFISFLNDWFTHHICIIDKRYAEWIQAHVLSS